MAIIGGFSPVAVYRAVYVHPKYLFNQHKDHTFYMSFYVYEHVKL